MYVLVGRATVEKAVLVGSGEQTLVSEDSRSKSKNVDKYIYKNVHVDMWL